MPCPITITGMRQWVRRHPKLALALALVIEWVVLLAGHLVLGDPILDSLFGATFWTVASGIMLASERSRSGRTKARLRENGQIHAYVRYPDALPGSLSGIWNMGIATPHAGWIDFQPAVYDTLEPSGRPEKIKVLDMLPGRRWITGKERKYIGGLGIQAMSLVTEKGIVEIAGQPESLHRLVVAVEGGS